MRIFHEEAMMNEEYMRQCYDAAYQAQNHEYLTLVSPEYFQFGTALLTKVVSVFDQSRLKREGNKAALLAPVAQTTKWSSLATVPMPK